MTHSSAIRAARKLSLLLLIPACLTRFLPAQPTVTILQKVNPATPRIVWPTPLPIPFGTPLDRTELNATSTVPGSFSYDPDQGALLPAGMNTLTVRFLPASPNYNPTVASVVLEVTPPGDSTFTLLRQGVDTGLETIVIHPGRPATVHLVIGPVRNFHQPVSLSCANVQPGVSCKFFPETVRPEFAPTPIDLTVSYRLIASDSWTGGKILAAILLFGLAAPRRGGLRASRRWIRLALLALISFTVLSASQGCIYNQSWIRPRMLQITAKSLVESRTLELPYYAER